MHAWSWAAPPAPATGRRYPAPYPAPRQGKCCWRIQPCDQGRAAALVAETPAQTPTPAPKKPLTEPGAWDLRSERGVDFVTGGAFFRSESCAGRDLAVLAAALQRRRAGQLRVMDVMCGSGMRGARYLLEGDADEVWVNDGSPDLHAAMVHNLCRAAGMERGAAAGADEPALAGAAGASGAAERPAGEGSADVKGSSAEGAGAGAGSTAREASGPEASVRRQAAAWEAQAQVVRLEGLKRDVWEWDLPAPGAAPRAAGAEAGGQGVAGSAPEASGRASGECSTSPAAAAEAAAGAAGGRTRRLRLSHVDANRLLTSCYMREEYYDLLDIDSFGSDTMHFPAAIDAVRYNGLLYLTSTDGFTSAGKRPERGLAAYGAHLRAMPWSNEQGLRMVIGAAVREAAARGVCLRPVFSLYSYHGPVFRVMLRATRTAEWPAQHYGFVGHCFVHSDNYTVGWRSLGSAVCRCDTRLRGLAAGGAGGSGGGAPGADGAEESAGLEEPPRSTVAGPGGHAAHACSSSSSSSGTGTGTGTSQPDGEAHTGGDGAPSGSGSGNSSSGDGGGTPLVVSGPMWTGPLHDAAELAALAGEARARGWWDLPCEAPLTGRTGSSKPKNSRPSRTLGQLLEVLAEEADPRLPPGFFSIDAAVAKRLQRPPPRDALIDALRAEGYAAARCHLEARALRTNAPMRELLRVAEVRLGIKRR